MDFKGKKVLITGGSRGIGRATAIAFSRQGATCGINYRNDDMAAKAAMDMLEGPDHAALKFDISDGSQVEALVNEFLIRYGRLDILVINAAIIVPHSLEDVDYGTWREAWKRIIDTNLLAAANLCYCASKYMIRDGGGRIISVSSRGAFRGEPSLPAYGASKAGLNALSQSLAKALGKHRIFVGVVAPGFTETDMGLDDLGEVERSRLLEDTPLGRMARPEEIAHAILFLASEGAEYTTGAIIDMNGASYLRT